jgi:hypothetical protein
LPDQTERIYAEQGEEPAKASWYEDQRFGISDAGDVMTFYNGNGKRRPARNVLGGELKTCSMKPLTGFYRNGKCDTGFQDTGVHTVCAKVTKEFLEFSVAQGNDLVTPMPAFNFSGSEAG